MRKSGRWTNELAAIAILIASSVSCGGDDSGGSGGVIQTGSGGLTVTMKDLAFVPFALTVPAGQDTTIQLVNQDGVWHSFTLDDDSASRELEGGESSSITINISGMTGWHCEHHDDMRGTVRVA
jgi:plastocyanin